MLARHCRRAEAEGVAPPAPPVPRPPQFTENSEYLRLSDGKS